MRGGRRLAFLPLKTEQFFLMTAGRRAFGFATATMTTKEGEETRITSIAKIGNNKRHLGRSHPL